MPASTVHAVLVARPDTRALGLTHFSETIRAIREQSMPVDALTIVLCGRDERFAEAANASGAEGIIQADGSTGFAEAIALASARVDPDSALWLLAQDTVPAPEALRQLAGMLEIGPSIAVVAPKLVRRDDQDVIASMGVSMTEGGAAIELAAGQFDQGQHDSTEDVLGADVRGMLLRAQRRADLLPDPALGGADEGLDIGVRARLGGARVAIAPLARVAVSADGVAGLPEPNTAADRRRISYVTRLAQLHRRLTYAPSAAVPLHLLSLLPIALWRAMASLLAKLPGQVLPEAAATLVAATRWGAIARSRHRLRGLRGNWSRVEPLRIGRAERQLLTTEDGPRGAVVSGELRFFSGGGAWLVLAMLVASIAAFPLLLGWPVLGGGAALPLRTTVAQLWTDTGFGLRGYGLTEIAPADPFAYIVALLGSLVPASPSSAMVALWVLALPLAALGGWFAATRITERPSLRIVAGIAWALAPSLMSALLHPRPAAVIAHLLLPWLFLMGSVAHRSWSAAGAASLLLAAVAACSPSLGAFGCCVVVIGAVFAFATGRLSAAARVVWLLVPTLVVFLPLLWRRLADGDPLALLADPGAPWQGGRTTDDLLGRLATLAGAPDGTAGGWTSFLDALGVPDATAVAPWTLLLIVPFVVLAVLAPASSRWRVGTALLLSAAGAGVAAVLVSRISVTVLDGAAIAIWPGALVSAVWLTVVLAAALTAETLPAPRMITATAMTVATLLLVVNAVPALTATARGADELQNGPRSTLPAYVAATLTDGAGGATLVLTVLADGSIAQRVVWGGSDTLGAQSTVLTSALEADPEDERIASVIATLVTPDADADPGLAELGIRFVLLEPVRQSTGVAAALRAQASSALTQRAGLAAVGETGKGALWQVEATPAARTTLDDNQLSTARWSWSAVAVVALIAVLLAVPTRASVRAARVRGRLIGLGRPKP